MAGKKDEVWAKTDPGIYAPSALPTSINPQRRGVGNASQSSTAPLIAHWLHTRVLTGQVRLGAQEQNGRELHPYAKITTQRAADLLQIATDVTSA